MAPTAQHFRRSARNFRAWLERGDDADADDVFTDAALRERLSNPLRFLEVPLESGAVALPPEAKSLAEQAAPQLGVSREVAQDLVGLLAEDRLGSLVLHLEGSVFDLLDLSPAGALPSLTNLLHAERCEALQALAVVLRGAHDDSHPFAAQCRELAQKLLSEDLERKLWDVYVKVSACPRFSSSPEHGEVETVVKQGLELQLCVLECLLLAGYDSQISRSDPEQICRIAEECYRQRFLGSLPRAAHHHHWLLGDAEICVQAQCVGDLCLALLIEQLGLEGLNQAMHRHPLLSSPEHMQHLHKLIEGSWLEVCRVAEPSAAAHCGRHVALVVLGWAVLLASAPETFREAHGLGLKRLFSSAVFQAPHLLQDAVRRIQDRGFLACDSRNAKHLAARSVLRGMVSVSTVALRLDGPMAPIHGALSKMASMAFAGDPPACLEFWRSDYPKREGVFAVLHAWLTCFPRGLACLLELLAGLAQGFGALYTCELMQAPLNMMQLPYRMLKHAADFEEAPASSTFLQRAPLVLREPVYVEELALRVLGLELPERHVASCAVLPAGSRGVLEHDRPDPDLSPRASHAHMVRWTLPAGVSIWRVALCAWDAILGAKQRSADDLELLKQITRCLSQVLIDSPESLDHFLKDLPGDEQGSCQGVVARLLASLFVLRESALAPLRALAKCCTDPSAARALLRLEGVPNRSSAELVALLAGIADAERQAGAYPATCAALEMIRNVFQACPVELWSLPLDVHDSLGLPSFTKPGAPTSGGPSGEVLGPLLDFVFGTFSRCGFWPCRSVGQRLAVSQGCLQVAMALLPALECFNWPEVVRHSSQDTSLARTLQTLRELQISVLRCWGEVSFVQTLLQSIQCEIAYGPAGKDEGRRFVGFRSPALEVEVQSAPDVLGTGGVVPTTGAQLLSTALQCFHGLVRLFLGPAGFAPHYQPLLQHLLALTTTRESLGPYSSTEALPLRRADLVQSLYAHICCQETPVAQWGTECMVSLCALWCRAEMRHAGQAKPGGRGLLLACLSVPSEAQKHGLVLHLAKRLLAVLRDPAQAVDFRSACADLCRAALVSQPGLLLEAKEELLPGCVAAAAEALAELSEAPVGEEKARLFFASLTLLDDVAALGDEILPHLDKSVEVKILKPQRSVSHDSTWKLLRKVFEDVLQPWLSSGDCKAHLCMAAVLRLAERGAGKGHKDLKELMKQLLTAKTLGMLNPDGLQEDSPDGSGAGVRPELQREVSFGVFLRGQAFAPAGGDFEMLQHPYGDPSSETEGVCQRFQGLLAQLELRQEVIAPSTSAAGSEALASGWLPGSGGSSGAVAQDLAARLEAKGRPSVPACFRCWGELCEVACGGALEPRVSRAHSLPLERIGCFGSRGTVAQAHCGSDIVDGFVASSALLPLHVPTVRLAAASASAAGLSRGQRGPCDPNDPVMQALRSLISELPKVSSTQAFQAANALALEAFDDLAKVAARLARQDTELGGVFAPLVWSLTHQLHRSMRNLAELMEKPQLLARLLALASHLFALPPHGAALAAPGQAYGAFAALAAGEGHRGQLHAMLSHETPAGLALVAQLCVALRSGLQKMRHQLLPPRAADMLASAGLMVAGAEAHEGVLGHSTDGAYAEVVLHATSLLLQLVPALGHPASQQSSLQATPLLTSLLEVLGQLFQFLIASEQARERWRQNQVAAAAAKLAGDLAVPEVAKDDRPGPVPGWPARAPVGAGGPTVQVLKTPEDAAVRQASEMQAEKFDQILHSGFSSLVFALTEKTLAALRARQGESGQDAASDQLHHALLPRLLNCSFSVFAPSDSSQVHLRGSQSMWQRASEASWACRLESLLGLLLRVAQTPSGAALLVEQRVFVLLAYCPLLRHFVLNTDSPYMVPSNTFDSASLVSERQWVTWRRPAHSAWCRVLLLVATILASGATSEEAEVFLQVYNKRFCFVFQTSLQSGHMAVLEEASLMGRVLAFLCQRSAVARSLAAEAAAQAMVFVMNSCLTERSRPSEVFLPRSGEERLAAQVPEMAVGEIPAQAPSIFHQRVEYLGLELLRNLLLALLRISSLPQWLSLAQAATKVTEINPAQGWPTAYQSVFGLKDAGGTAALNAAESDPVRLWAVLMDVTMETGKKAAEYLETLNGQRQEMHRLTIANSAMEADAGDAWLPLSLALVGIGELGAPDGPASPGFASPQAAPGQTPLATAWSPTLPPVTEPRTSNRVRALRYKFAARRPNATLGSQLCTATPEGVTLRELKKLASSVLELSSMLLCRFCQVTQSSMLSAAARASAGPGGAILHSLLSFLHDVLSLSESGAAPLEAETATFLSALRARAEQNLGTEAKVQQSGEQANPAFDGDAWVLGEA